jgi:hypothetical protein
MLTVLSNDWGLKHAFQRQRAPEVHTQNLKDLVLPAVAIFLVALGVYAYTLAPTILWGDPAKLARFVHAGQPLYLGGGNHGLHTQLGMVFAYLLPEAWPLAYKTNFMSAVWASSFYGKARQLFQLLPVFILFGYFITAGFASVAAKMAPKKFLMLLLAATLLQPATYFVVTRSASYLFHVNLFSESTFPYHDAKIYYLWPSKRGDHITYDFARNAFSVMETGAVILTDFNIYEPLRYLQIVEGVRPDIRVKCTNDFCYQPVETIWQDLCHYIDEQLANHQPVYMAAYESFNFFIIDKDTVPFRSRLDAAYLIRPAGNIFRIVGKK